MHSRTWETVYTNCHLATMEPGSDYGIINDAALAVQHGKIAWLGQQSDLPASDAEVIDLQGAWMTPGLIDCHTHVVYAGDRANEFEQRLQGVSYAEIAKAGGGIRATVSATRQASEAELYAQSAKRLQAMLAHGVTTVEIKSGYGLDLVNEQKMLQVARRLGEDFPVTVRTTFLGAHAVPPEYANQADAYIDLVCQQLLPAIAAEKLADAVDIFCESIGFDLAQTEKVMQAAQQHHLPVKIHAEQLSDLGGTALAARYRALSADHLEYLSVQGVAAMAQANMVAVLLPGAFYFLQAQQRPPIELLREHQVPIAIATDCNPGSSPTTSLPLMLNMACTLFGLTPAEALAGVTRHAAQALGLQSKIGTLTVGKKADLAVWDIQSPAELAYFMGDVKNITVIVA